METKTFPTVTKLGNIKITPHTATNVVVEFEALKVNGVTYRGTMYFKNYGNGLTPSRTHSDRPESTWDALYASRVDNCLVNPTNAARKQLFAVLSAKVAEWETDNGQALLDAEIADRRAALGNLEEKRAELQKQLAETVDQIGWTQREIKKLEKR